MPNRRPDEPPEWPVLPQPWWRDVKGVVVPYWVGGATWGVYLSGAAWAVIMIARDGWRGGILVAVIGVVAAGCSLLADAFRLVWFRDRTSSTWWIAVKLVLVVAFYGLCVAIGANKLAIVVLAITSGMFLLPLALVGVLGGLKRN